MVKVLKNEEVPADILIIAAPKDVVFVSTMNLDGETSLKDRELAVTGPGAPMSEADLAAFRGQIECDAPNESLDDWDGNLSSVALGRI